MGSLGKGINWAPPWAPPLWVCLRVEPSRGSGVAAELFPTAATSQPWRDVCSGRVPVWLRGITGKAFFQSGKVPVPSAEATVFSGFNKK